MSTKYGQRPNEVVIALTQTSTGMLLHEIAEALLAPLTSVQRAVASLGDDELLRTERGHPPRYAINDSHPAAAALTGFSLRVVPLQRTMDVLVRANPAVEFCGRDQDGYFIVLSPFAEPADVVRLRDAIERANEMRDDALRFEIVEREDVHARLREDLRLRGRGLHLSPVKGSASRTFRNPNEHGSFDGTPLGGLHPSLPPLPHRAIKRLADKYGLARLAVFGSSVREDFRPDSDVDVMVEALPRSPIRLATLLGVQEQLEKLLQRDVDVVNARAMDDSILHRVEKEGVVLYGRTGSTAS